MLTDTAIRAAMRTGKQTTLRDAGRRGEARLILANQAANVPADFDISRTGDRHLSQDEFRRVWVWLGEWAGRYDGRACAALRVMMATDPR